MGMLRDGIVRTICLGTTLIADEDHLVATILQLLQVWRRVPNIHDAPKRPEVVHRRLLPMPCHKRGHAVNALRWAPVQHIHNSTHRLPLEPPV
jgi:hypothetical protein